MIGFSVVQLLLKELLHSRISKDLTCAQRLKISMIEERTSSKVQELHLTLLSDEQMSLAEFIGLCIAGADRPVGPSAARR